MQKKIIGFYQSKNQVLTARSVVPDIFDMSLKIKYQLQFVPVVLEAGAVWQVHHSIQLPDSLSQIFQNNLRFETSPNKISPYACLMYVNSKKPDDFISGILVEESLDFQKKPVIIRINSQPFLVELSGVGLPVGGFLGCDEYDKTAHHDTVFQKYYQNQVSLKNTKAVIPVACGYFNLKKADKLHKIGMTIRLVPSTLRASFFHPQLIDVMPSPEKAMASISAGQEILNQYASKKPYALGLHDMIWADQNQFVVANLR